MKSRRRRDVLQLLGAGLVGTAATGSARAWRPQWEWEETALDGVPASGPTVYIPHEWLNPALVAYDLVTGEPYWRYTEESRYHRATGTDWDITGDPIVVDGLVYFPSMYPFEMHALDATTGEHVWRTSELLESPPHIASGPTVADGVLYAGGTEHEDTDEVGVYAHDATTGALQWHVPDLDIRESPAVRHGTVFVCSREKCHALDASTGDEQWSVALDFPGDCRNVYVWDETVIVVGRTGAIAALDREDGTIRWELPPHEPFNQFWLTVVDDWIYGGRSIRDYETAKLARRSVETGEPGWETSAARFIGGDSSVTPGAAPTVYRDTVYMGGKSLVAFDEDDGIEQWRLNDFGSLNGVQTAALGHVFTFHHQISRHPEYKDQSVFAIDLSTREQAWYATRGKYQLSPTVVAHPGGSSIDTRCLQGTLNHHDARCALDPGTNETIGDDPVALQVMVPDVVEPGDDVTVTVQAIDALGRQTDVTSTATIESEVPGVAAVTNEGAINARSAGETTVHASYGDLTETATFTVVADWVIFDMGLPNDGGIHALGFPGPVVGTLGQQFPAGFKGVSGFYRFHSGGWTRIQAPDRYEPQPLEVIAVVTNGSESPGTIPVTVMIATDTESENVSLEPGWHLIAPPRYGTPPDCLSSLEVGFLMDRFDHPRPGNAMRASMSMPSEDTFGHYSLELADLYDGGPMLSPFTGYFLFTRETASVPPMADGVDSYQVACESLGLTSQ